MRDMHQPTTFWPKENSDRLLMQHCVNEDLSAVNELGMEKVVHVALAHGWIVDVEEVNKI
jgi:hypothetical protein